MATVLYVMLVCYFFCKSVVLHITGYVHYSLPASLVSIEQVVSGLDPGFRKRGGLHP